MSRTRIVARAEGNPFFAEELLAAGGELPRRVRDVLTARLTGLDRTARSLLRVAAAAGRDVSYPLLVAVAALPERDVRESLREAVEHGVLVSEPARGRFRFRHALLAEAVYETVLPGEREWLHARIADELSRSADAGPAELAPHWALAGRSADALAASIEAAREAEAVFGLAEALSHLERALSLWDAVPDSGLDLADLCAWAAELAGHVGAAPRAVELARRAIELVGPGDPRRAARCMLRLGEHLLSTGAGEAALAAFERAVELVPAASPERAWAVGSLAGAFMVAWRHAESLPLSEKALALARENGAGEAEVRALTVLAGDLAYLGRGDEGVGHFRDAVRLAEEIGDHLGLDRAYTNFTDALTMLGRPRESARVAQAGLDVMRRYGIHSTGLVSNRIEALVAIGEWDEAERLSAAALHSFTPSFRHWLLVIRASVEIGRGEFDAARAHLDGAGDAVREDGVGLYDAYVAELALWERRWTDAEAAVEAGLARARRRRLRRSASSSAPWGCARRPSWRRLPAPAGTPTACANGSAAPTHCSPTRAKPPRRPRRSRRTPPAGSPWPRPSASARPAVGGRRRRLGPARAPAARGLLPLARGRGARGRRRAARRGYGSAERGLRRRDPAAGAAARA